MICRRTVLLALLLIGCKAKQRESDDQRLRRYREAVCACKDQACVDAAFAILKESDAPARAAPSEEITRASECIAKIANGTAETPSKPARYHADDLLRAARTWQQAAFPKLAIWNLNVMYVEANAMLDADHGGLTIRYGAPNKFVDDPKRKTGAPVDTETARQTACPLLTATKDAWSRSDEYCRVAEPYAVKCTVEQIWQRAIAQGAPADALATVAFTNTEYRFWRFAIDDAPRNVHIAYDFPDDCAAIVEKP